MNVLPKKWSDRKLVQWSKLLGAFAVLLTLGCAGHVNLGLPSASPEVVGLSASALARVEPVLRSYVDSGKLSGIVAVIARQGRIGYVRSVGVMDLATHKPLRADAVFKIYSMSKPIVAAATMVLAERGQLGLDDPVAKYIPAFAHLKVYVSGTSDQMMLRDATAPMTVRHLLTHTGGLVYGTRQTPADSLLLRAQLYNPSSTLAQFADSITRIPLIFDPGTGWNYSASIDVLGRVLEVASGEPLDELLAEAIFRPLKMHDTGFRIRPDMRERIPTLYASGDSGIVSTEGGTLGGMFLPGARFFWASGGLLSTPGDYLRFAQMLLNGGDLDGVRVLSRESVAEMTKNQLPPGMTPLTSAQFSYDGGYGQAFAGVVLVDSTKAKLGGSPGLYRWSGYVGTYFWIDPKAQLVAMVWTQFAPGRAYSLEQEFQRLVYDAVIR